MSLLYGFIPSVPLVAAIVLGGWLLFLLTRHYIWASTLDNVPGPKPTSLLFGSCSTANEHPLWLLTHTTFPGSTHSIFGRHSRAFHYDMWKKFGAVVKLRTFLGVGSLSQTCIFLLTKSRSNRCCTSTTQKRCTIS